MTDETCAEVKRSRHCKLMAAMNECVHTLPLGECHHLYTLRCGSMLDDLDWGENNSKTRLIASAVLSARYVTLRANVAQRTHRGEALCSATVTISRLWHRFQEAENQARSSICV